MEPFDEALDRSVWILSDQRLKSDLGIAEKRRGKPKQTESAFRDHLSNLESLDAKATAQLAHQDVSLTADGECPVDVADSCTNANPTDPLDLQVQEQTFERISALSKEVHQVYTVLSFRRRSLTCWVCSRCLSSTNDPLPSRPLLQR